MPSEQNMNCLIQNTDLNTENTRAIFPMARILFRITSLRKLAALPVDVCVCALISAIRRFFFLNENGKIGNEREKKKTRTQNV